MKRITWAMVRFTDVDDGPVFIDLLQIAAITDARLNTTSANALPSMVLGARVVLMSGVALYTKESADTVFAELHRARTEKEPDPEPMRVGDPAL